MTEGAETKKGFKWRRWNRVIHRDLGYSFAALTIIYAISGVAVNHIEDWNPNYELRTERREFEPVEVSSRDQMVEQLIQRLELPPDYIDVFRPDPETVILFYDGFQVTADATEGVATWERARKRTGLFEANYLHLNRGKGWWTWFADIYALGLTLLAISGLIMLRGVKGFVGRGKWFFAAGLAIPLFFLFLSR